MPDPLQALRETGAVLQGHFRLASGLHSDTYVQKFRLFQHPRLTEGLARALAAGCAGLGARVVAAPAVGAIVFGYELARALGIRSIFLEREGKAGFAPRTGMEPAPGEKVLCAEDVVTTGGSVLEMAGALEALGAEVVGFAALLDRSGANPPAFRKPFKALITMAPDQWPPEACPLCKAGAPLDTPGTRQKRLA